MNKNKWGNMEKDMTKTCKTEEEEEKEEEEGEGKEEKEGKGEEKESDMNNVISLTCHYCQRNYS